MGRPSRRVKWHFETAVADGRVTFPGCQDWQSRTAGLTGSDSSVTEGQPAHFYFSADVATLHGPTPPRPVINQIRHFPAVEIQHITFWLDYADQHVKNAGHGIHQFYWFFTRETAAAADPEINHNRSWNTALHGINDS